MKKTIHYLPLLLLFAACNAANPPHGEEQLPDSASASMTNTDNNRTVYPAAPDSNTPNQSVISADTSMRDTRNHFIDTNKNKRNTTP